MEIFRMAMDYTDEINDPLLIRHVNYDLINNIKPYRVDFSDEAIFYFINETKTYWKKLNFIMMMELLTILKLIII